MKRCRQLLYFLLLLISHYSFAQEICNNGKDDNGDGLVDITDPECQCHFNVTGNLLQNASFELYKNCPTNYSYDNDSGIIEHWKYGAYTNGNDAEYYHNFNCSYDSALVMRYIPPALPLPDGDGFVAVRQYVYRKSQMQEADMAKVYISQCLQAPLRGGEQYTLSFDAGRFRSNDDPAFKYKSAPFTVAIFGHADCNAVPFGPQHANSSGCATKYPGWILLGKTTVNSSGKWAQSRIDFIAPAGINVIEIGPDCSVLTPDIDLADSTTFLDFYVYYLDDLHLLPTKDFHFPHIQHQDGNPCSIDSILKAPDFTNAGYQWYKDSIAIAGATRNTFHLLKNSPPGSYNVRITTRSSCVITDPFRVGFSDINTLNLPADTSLCENDSLLLGPPLNGVKYTVNGSASNTVTILRAGIYTITAADVNGCTLHFTINVRTQNCQVFMPNTFTPNADGKNDVFRIAGEVKIHLKEFSVFDVWGNKVFSTTNSSTGWDGRFKGIDSSTGTYVYRIKGTANNKQIALKGVVTLLR